MKKALRLLCVLWVWTIASCAPSQAASPPRFPGFNLVTVAPNATATATPFQPVLPSATSVPSATLLPTNTIIPSSTAVPADTATFAPPPPTDTRVPLPNNPSPTSVPVNTRTQYTFDVNLKYSAHTLHADETIRYTNTTGQTLWNIVMAVVPNLSSNCFYLNGITQSSRTLTDYSLNGQRLTINLPQALTPNAITVFTLSFDLALPPKSFAKPFGYLADQINLSDWYPFIVPYENGWVLHDPWPFGEWLVYDAADYDVNLKVDDPSVIIAASAPGQLNGDWMEYRLEAARTFVLSASDSFKVDDSAVGSVKIRSYYFPGDENASGEVLWIATQSLGLYDAKFAPYPYQSISVVETDVPDGQEYDGLVFLSKNFYEQYNGTAKSNLATICTHEIAHQWWFGLVGSDQAEEPWLDEAMAVYSEHIFYEYNYPNFGNWWWNFRSYNFGASGYVDGSIYDYSTFHAYVSAVYMNGAKFLDALRTRLGDDAYFAFLKDYASRYAHKHATAADFFATLRLDTRTDFSDIIQQYFQQSY
ncbi:MAG TPA: M1 family aminopeptidase [Anaerolineales bacterium]|nr:M1 family aminopeptidase [Anaerolineales bacterium]